MSSDTMWIIAVAAFFGVFGAVLFVVSIWSNQVPRVRKARAPKAPAPSRAVQWPWGDAEPSGQG